MFPIKNPQKSRSVVHGPPARARWQPAPSVHWGLRRGRRAAALWRRRRGWAQRQAGRCAHGGGLVGQGRASGLGFLQRRSSPKRVPFLEGEDGKSDLPLPRQRKRKMQPLRTQKVPPKNRTERSVRYETVLRGPRDNEVLWALQNFSKVNIESLYTVALLGL